MRTLNRNKRTLYYCRYISNRVPGDTAVAGEAISGLSVIDDDEQEINYIMDEYGNQNGETIPYYATPVAYRANYSPASGAVQAEMFGDLEQYDRVIVVDTDCPIDEHTVLFIEKEPTFSSVTTYAYDDDNELVEKTYYVPDYNYIVRRVSTSLNNKAIAVRQVKVG